VLNEIIFASAWLPLVVVGVLCWWFFRAARRNDREEEARRAEAIPESTPDERTP